MRSGSRWLAGCVAIASLASLASCRKLDPEYCNTHDCSGDAGIVGTLRISVTVTGLSGMGLVLENNATDDLAVPTGADGKYTFDTLLVPGATYDVTIATQPTQPAQMCTVMNGSGTADADVSNIEVTCMTAAFKIGGTVGGLDPSTSVVLHNVNGDTVSVAMDGTFAFPMAVPSGTNYTVDVKTQPATGGPCNVFGNQGTVGNTDVTSIIVNCSSTMFAIGGSVTGLDGTAIVTNSNNGDTQTLTANGSFAFPKLVAAGSAYSVTVTQQPAYPPAQQTCNVSMGSGTATTNVTSIAISCTTKTYTIGGMINGLNGTVVLQDNGVDTLTRTSNGGFTFAMPVASGSSYAVTVKTQPSMELCKLAGAAGTVKTQNITSVMVSCAYQDPGIACGGSFCDPSQDVCCDPEGNATCMASGSCFNNPLPCDDSADCTAAGTPGICCVQVNGGGHFQGVSCQSSCSGPRMCDPNAPSCPPRQRCQSYSDLPGYYTCQ